MKKFLIYSAFAVLNAYFAIATYGNFILISKPSLGVEIDEQTGCQYMVSRRGGVSPRIDADGVHMGCKGLQESSQ